MPEIGYGQRGASLEERDYIGLAPAAAEMKCRNESPVRKDDVDLRLDLGLGLTLGSSCGDGESGAGGAGTKPAMEILPEQSFPSRGAGMKRAASELSRKPLWLGASNAISDNCNHDSAADDAPPAKDQIVGWPPVRLYRKQTLSKPAEMFVKVNMDGMTVGRKVDLNAYGSYKGLLLALEEMFRPAGRDGDMKHFLLSSEPDYVLTYEDKEGDWMLVGDVPWSIFVTTVRRLRITRGLEANGTGMGMLCRSRVMFRG